MLRATYSAEKGLKIHIWDKQNRPRRWQVDGTYMTPSGLQTFHVKASKACWMNELSGLIEAAIREDEKLTGRVDDIKWTAVGR